MPQRLERVVEKETSSTLLGVGRISRPTKTECRHGAPCWGFATGNRLFSSFARVTLKCSVYPTYSLFRQDSKLPMQPLPSTSDSRQPPDNGHALVNVAESVQKAATYAQPKRALLGNRPVVFISDVIVHVRLVDMLIGRERGRLIRRGRVVVVDVDAAAAAAAGTVALDAPVQVRQRQRQGGVADPAELELRVDARDVAAGADAVEELLGRLAVDEGDVRHRRRRVDVGELPYALRKLR
jgi:hypothetical protein